MKDRQSRSKIENWCRALDQTTHDFMDEFGALTPSQLNWKPNPGTWSIGQNIHHLIVINSTYFPVLDQLHSGSYNVPFHGRIGFLTNLMGKMVLRASHPDRKMKTTTFPIWKPSESEISDDILQQFERHQSDLKRHFEQAEGLLETRTVISSPANRNIVYPLSTAFEIIVTHERRHLVQAQEILKLMA